MEIPQKSKNRGTTCPSCTSPAYKPKLKQINTEQRFPHTMFIELLLSYFIIVELCLLLTIHSSYRIRICVHQKRMDDKSDNFVISLKEV